jgi:hypothetical protein
MKLSDYRNITNSFRDVQLISLHHWAMASEIQPQDHGGPYVITQLGFDPEDQTFTPDEFVLGRSGMWLSLSYFFQMPVPRAPGRICLRHFRRSDDADEFVAFNCPHSPARHENRAAQAR